MVDLFTRYLYFWGSLVALGVFMIFFMLRPDLRHRMLKLGGAVALAGVLSEAVFFQDYWRPPLLVRFGPFGGIEDLLFGFAIGGIAGALYLTVFHERLRRKGHPHRWVIPAIIVSELLAVVVLFHGLGLNSIYATAIGFLAPATIIVIIRRDLLIETLFSGALFGCLLGLAEMAALRFAPTYLQHYYLLFGHAPLVLGIAPLTEFMWGAAFAALVGPVLDFDYGLAPRPIHNNSKVALRKSQPRRRRPVPATSKA